MFPLPYPRPHVGGIAVVALAVRGLIERIGLGVGQHLAHLPCHHASDHSGKVAVNGRQPQIGPHLRCGIPQLDRRNIAGDDKGGAIGLRAQCGLPGVGECRRKQRGQARVLRQVPGHLVHQPLH